MRILLRDGDKVIEIDTVHVPCAVEDLTAEARAAWRAMGWPIASELRVDTAPTQQFVPFGR